MFFFVFWGREEGCFFEFFGFFLCVFVFACFFFSFADVYEDGHRHAAKKGRGIMVVDVKCQPSEYYRPSKDLIVVVHVDDFLCSAEMKELEWLYDNLAQIFELKKSLIMKDSEAGSARAQPTSVFRYSRRPQRRTLQM